MATRIFVPYSQYYDYLEHEQWKIYKNQIYYSGSTGVIYTGINKNGVIDNNDIVSYMVGTGSNTPGNAYTSALDGEVLLGIPYYYGETTKLVTRIGLNAFMNNTSIQRVTISSTITNIGSYAFKGCSSLKYVILEGKTPPSIDIDVFADNPADRIFIVPDGSRTTYVSNNSWNKFEAYIIEWSDYQQMISGSGFTHFVLNCQSETTIGLNIYKFDSTTMTIIWGDGATDIVSGSFISDSKALTHTYLANANDYTISIIARGKWILSNSTTIFNGESGDMCLKEAYFDDFYCAYKDNANYLEGTYANGSLFVNALNLTRLQLSNNAISMPQGFLSKCTKLEFLKIPFPGTKQNTSGEVGLLGTLFHGMQAAVTTKEITQIYGTGGTDIYTVRVPANLKVVDVSGTATIMAGAFSGFDMIERIVLNGNTTKFEDYTFYKCASLYDMDIPLKITSIGKSCFEDCVKLKIESLPSTLVSIGEKSFYGCEVASFTSLPSGITIIPDYAFYNCYNITLSSLPSGLTSIGEYAFYECQRITISAIPSGVTNLPKAAFSGCKNITISAIPSGMTTIPDELFKNCEKISISSLPSGLTSIGEYAFYNCKNVTISKLPITLTEIKSYAFSGCILINIDNLADNITIIGSYAFEGCKNIIITNLPINLTSLTDGIFKDCSNIVLSFIPENITEIPKEAFSGCSSIIMTNLPTGLTHIGESAFMNCTSMKLTSLPSKLERIEANSFNNCTLLSISRIPSSVGFIGSKAFYNCQNINDTISIGNIMNKTATLSNGILNIYPDAFSWGNSSYGDMVSLLNIYKASSDPSCTGFINGDAYSQNAFTSVTTAQFTIVQESTANLFTYQEYILGDVTGYCITGFNSNDTGPAYIPDTYDGKPVIAIGDNAFNCDDNQFNSRPIYISDTSQIEMIGTNAFRDNGQSYDLVLPPNLKTIGDEAFYNCISVKVSELPSSLESIGENAFYNCQNINLSTIPQGIKNIKDGAFNKCSSITELYLKACSEIESFNIFNYRPDTTTGDGDGMMLIHKVSMPVNNTYIKNFITADIRYTIVIKFRAINSASFDIINLSHGYESSDTMTYGYRIHVLNGTIYVGNYSIYDNIKMNVTYTLIIRCSPTDEIIRNSILLATDDPEYFDINNMDKYESAEFNRFNFGYIHPVINTVTYGLYNFNFGNEDSNKAIVSSIDYWIGDYSNGSDVYLNDGYLTDLGINKLYNISTFTIPSSNKYVSSNFGSLLSTLAWSEIMALGREGYMYCENPTKYPYLSEWHIDIDRNAKEGTVGTVDTEKWFVLGEQRGMNLTYPEGAIYSNCNDIKLELIGFTSDVSDHYGTCPLTFGLVDLLPEKQQLYSSTHNMRDCVVTTRYNPTIYRDADGKIDADATNVENIVSTNASSFALPTVEDSSYTDGNYSESQKYIWIVANTYTAIGKIYVNKNGVLLSGINFNSTETNKYANFPKNEIVDGILEHNGEWFGVIDSWSGHLFDTASGTVDESTSCPTIILDATIGKIIRDENCECILLYPGAKIGIPVGGPNDGDQVNITYYNSYNLTGWRDCIVRNECNNYHYEALDLNVRNIVECVLKRTNVGGLQKAINETKDLLWLYSLSEAGMYNATEPYMYEGEAYQFYQPSVANNGGRTAVRKKKLFNNEDTTFQYWWLRTPMIHLNPYITDAYFAIIHKDLGHFHYNYTGIGFIYGVCFGLSTKANDRPRLYNADNYLESKTYLPISAASALSPQNGITHIYTFEIDKLDTSDALIDMRYSNTVGDTTYSHGYVVSIGSDGIWLNSKHILSNTEVSVGNKVTLIIRQNSIISEELSSEILVFINNEYFKKFIDTTGFGDNIRTYSMHSRQGIINANNRRRFENVSIFAKRLTDDELKDLFVCRLLDFGSAL